VGKLCGDRGEWVSGWVVGDGLFIWVGVKGLGVGVGGELWVS